MDRNILVVDDHRDILRLLHSTLDTLKNEKLTIFEAPSGEEALLESIRHRIDLLVTDYKLPGMSGVELMHKVRARHPEVKVIFITGMTDKKMRDEMLNAGALAIFDKPISMADFLDAVERGLGLVQTIFPTEKTGGMVEERHTRLSDLLANFRQDIQADAVFLINERGLVQARTGAFRDSSMEVSLISTLMAIHSASLKVARHNHQETLDSYHVFSGGDHDLLFIPVTPLYALLVAGNGLATEARILESVAGLLALRDQIEKALKSMGVTGELNAAIAQSKPAPKRQTDKLASATPAPEMEALLNQAATQKTKVNNADDFWNEAAQKHANKSSNPEVISFEEARKLGILPDGN
ncbi:MAG: response regulator [Anaerolineales bacterium]|nr:response regulator [Anaerolineales bacterium]WKZ40639.1 MAG: response regulator [Anaerolineales bacterium]